MTKNMKNVSSQEVEEPKQAYSWGLSTYASEEQIFRFCREQGRNWAFAYHDKDKAEPHTHIVITFEQRKSFSSVMRLAKTYFPNCTTLAEMIRDLGGKLLYLTHETETAKKEGKFQYDREIVKYSSEDFYKKYVKGEEPSENDLFVEDLLCPREQFSVIRMAKRYGRDFIKNVKSYLDFRSMALAEQAGVNPLDYHYQAYSTEDTISIQRNAEGVNSILKGE